MTKRCIHLFNPENDLALASGQANYTPPPNALLLHQAGASLPLWYGNDGDKVIMPAEYRQWVLSVQQQFSLPTDIFNPDENNDDCRPAPWGWSENACRQFALAGIPQHIIPGSDTIARLRTLSHRRITIDIISRLKDMLPFNTPPIPTEAHSVAEIRQFALTYPDFYIKLPWSSSGRGVIRSTSLPDSELARRCEGMIRRQGSVMCEKSLDKVLDFAMLFESDGSSVRHSGYSVFFNEHGTAYSGNIVVDDAVIEEYLSRHISADILHKTSSALETILSDIIAPHYTGFFGVDMMLYRDGGNISIAPCIEVNLRMTMGVVAKRLNRILAPGSYATFRVGYGKSNRPSSSPVIENQRLVKGHLSLIPPHDNFHIYMEAGQGSEFLKLGI